MTNVTCVTFNEFVEQVIDLGVNVDENYGAKYKDLYSYRIHDKKNIVEPGVWAVSIKWYTGGISGGSCWDEGDENNHYATTGEEEPEFTDFETIILHFVPNITFVEFRDIRKLVKQKEWTDYEYYGNSTNYAEKYVYLEDIYNFLKEKGYLE